MKKNIILLHVFILAAFSVMANKTYSAFQVEVTGQGQPVLLIPGATCSMHEWDETIAHYNGKFQFHAFTLAGYAGVAPISNGPYLDSFRVQIEEYIKDNHLKKVILIGHSIGGFLSLWIGIDNPPELQKIVAVDALPFLAALRNPAAKDGFNEEMAKSMLKQYSEMDNAALYKAQLTFAQYMCKDSTHWNQIATWGSESDKKTMAYSMMEMMGHDIRKSVDSIKVPVLVLAAFDVNPRFPNYTRADALKLYTDQYANCKTCIVHMPDGGTKHFVMYDNPKWYYSELDRFLN